MHCVRIDARVPLGRCGERQSCCLRWDGLDCDAGRNGYPLRGRCCVVSHAGDGIGPHGGLAIRTDTRVPKLVQGWPVRDNCAGHRWGLASVVVAYVDCDGLVATDMDGVAKRCTRWLIDGAAGY